MTVVVFQTIYVFIQTVLLLIHFNPDSASRFKIIQFSQYSESQSISQEIG